MILLSSRSGFFAMKSANDDKAQKRLAHVLNGRFDVVLREIHVRKPHMSFVVELRRRDRVGLECRSKGAIFLGDLVRFHAAPRRTGSRGGSQSQVCCGLAG